MKVQTVTVIGANGAMGCKIAAVFAAFGNAKVYMLSRSLEKSQKAIAKAVNSVRADSIKAKLIAADYSMLAACVRESDLVFESAAEDLTIKLDITRKIAESLSENAIACSGTSGLLITTLAECFPERLRGNYFGVHLFNPPYSMPLCEVIPTKYTNHERFEEVKQYLADVLLRTVVEVKDSPAFLANRIGFQFINESLQYAQKYQYNGGIDYIDSIFGRFTGRAMPPLTTADFVGLDVHKAIVDNLYENTNDYAHETFVFPEFAKKLVTEGKLGRKSGGGLYRLQVYDNGMKRHTVYDISTGIYRDRINYTFPFVEAMLDNLHTGDYAAAFKALIRNRSIEAELCLRFLLQYILYALSTTQEISDKISAADDVMATGFNWCPPLALLQAFAAVTDLQALLRERIDSAILEKLDLDKLLNAADGSKYDYRPYFKAKR